MERGKVKWFDEKKGYGFIETESGGDVFVHVSGLQNKELKSLQPGAAVEFEIKTGKKGPQAMNVVLV
ncbi:MAG: cold shock domain-containing protein [Bacteroidetes bacterium]|nr:cold shock domain-containing protein [Bacteroidota bacterium]MCW5897375.1 cold shock domain-containing protein [Bacteroidota bacterium]